MTIRTLCFLFFATSCGSFAAAVPAGPVVSDPQEAAQEAVEPPTPDVGIVTVSGRVLDPDGHPLSGARVWLQRTFAASLVNEQLHREYRDGSSIDWNEWFAVTTTDSEGEFRFDVHSAKWNVVHHPYVTQIAATSDGVGFGLAAMPAVFDRMEQPKLTIQTAVDQPIEGRIVSSDGQPAAQTVVQLMHVRAIGKPSADDYIADVIAGGTQYSNFDPRSTRVPGLAEIDLDAESGNSHVLTDDDGRFVLNGIGADRIVTLKVRGPMIPAEWFWVVTRLPPDGGPVAQTGGVLRLKIPNSEVRRPALAAAGFGDFGPSELPDRDQYYSRFTHKGEPARILRGIVRDRKTKEPVAGVRLHGVGIPATSGADGRYEISGCSKTDRYDVRLTTTSGKYLNVTIAVPDSPGIGILDRDFLLPKAITARGRVTDRDTGEPFEGTVEYNPLFPNEYLERLHLRLGADSDAIPRSSVPIAEDGSWELQVLPGPGILIVRVRNYYLPNSWRAMQETYTSARVDLNRLREVTGDADLGNHVSTEDIFYIDSGRGRGAFGMGASGCNSLAIIRPPVELMFDSQGVFTQDMVVVRGRDIQGIVLDPEGRPITGVFATGLSSLNPAVNHRLADERFTVRCASPDVPRRLQFIHHARNLRAEVEVEPNFQGQLTVHLKPAE